VLEGHVKIKTPRAARVMLPGGSPTPATGVVGEREAAEDGAAQGVRARSLNRIPELRIGDWLIG